jgi:Na+/alanine symporter
MMIFCIEFLRKNLKGLRNVLIAYLLLLVIFDILVPRDHAHYLIDKIRGFWTIFGIVGCFLLAKIAKGIAHSFLSKDEDYYG